MAEVFALDGTAETGGPVGDDVEEDRISWEDAFNYIGTEREVFGTVARSHNTWSVMFLNFSEDPFEGMNLVIFKRDFAKFGGTEALAKRLVGNRIVVKGEITTYRDRPQIILSSPDQILEVQ